MADTELTALERAERDTWNTYRHDGCNDDECPNRQRWLDALSALNRARIALARGDG